jgi:hypothetical protein
MHTHACFRILDQLLTRIPLHMPPKGIGTGCALHAECIGTLDTECLHAAYVGAIENLDSGLSWPDLFLLSMCMISIQLCPVRYNT